MMNCALCHDTGYKDQAGSAMDPCDQRQTIEARANPGDICNCGHDRDEHDEKVCPAKSTTRPRPAPRFGSA